MSSDEPIDFTGDNDDEEIQITGEARGSQSISRSSTQIQIEALLSALEDDGFVLVGHVPPEETNVHGGEMPLVVHRGRLLSTDGAEEGRNTRNQYRDRPPKRGTSDSSGGDEGDLGRITAEGLQISFIRIPYDPETPKIEWYNKVNRQRLIIMMIFDTLKIPRRRQADFFANNHYFAKPWRLLNNRIKGMASRQIMRSWDIRTTALLKNMPHQRFRVVSLQDRCSACGKKHANIQFRAKVEMWGAEYCYETLIEDENKERQNRLEFTLGSVCFDVFTHNHATQHTVFEEYHCFKREIYEPYSRDPGLPYVYGTHGQVIDVDAVIAGLDRKHPDLKRQPMRNINRTLEKVMERRINPGRHHNDLFDDLDLGRRRSDFDGDDDEGDEDTGPRERSYDGVPNSQDDD